MPVRFSADVVPDRSSAETESPIYVYSSNKWNLARRISRWHTSASIETPDVNALVNNDRVLRRAGSSYHSCQPRVPISKLIKDVWFGFCAYVSASPSFTVLTTLLTIYALFGDDMRLMLSKKADDVYFDGCTYLCMAAFSLEILTSVGGKPGYIFGFFFWLDIISTVTLVLDVSSVGEALLADSSNAEQGNGDALRAARMSRAGTRAGRVMRIIRIVRLIRLMKLLNMFTLSKNRVEEHVMRRRRSFENAVALPGAATASNRYRGYEDDELSLQKESAVSKKLSEMTTRRVIILVLIIMLMLPMFQAGFWVDSMTTSAVYGLTPLRNALEAGLERYHPWANATMRTQYLQSRHRAIYESDFLQYVYYHNWFCTEASMQAVGKVSVTELSRSPAWIGKLFWIGASYSGDGNADEVLEFVMPTNAVNDDWNARWGASGNFQYYTGELPDHIISHLRTPLSSSSHRCRGSSERYGFSLIQFQESDVLCPNDLRWQEHSLMGFSVTATEGGVLSIFFSFDVREDSVHSSLLNFLQTLFICFLLGYSAMRFSSDANKLVLMPIERMISKLAKIRNNPLEAMQIGESESHKETAARPSRKVQPNLKHRGRSTFSLSHLIHYLSTVKHKLWDGGRKAPEPMETVVLEKTIIKIGSLLALGFGEAGAEIIGENMRGSHNAALNAMIPGRRVEAIFGFCDIRNFTDATEVLQDQVMVFVNRIAGVVHSCINEFFGNPNKNIGDAFLLVWRLSGYPAKRMQKLADMSLICIIKIIARINTSQLLAEYRNHPKLVKRLPNYRVRMGFGLHKGWAIEGAIGSEFKIDASYLSPNVNLAASLESNTKQFGCLILLSKFVVDLMSREVARECRLIDCVLMNGTAEAFKMYTIDLDDLALEVEKGRARSLTGSDDVKYERWHDDFFMHSMFASDADIVTMRARFTVEFFCRFNMAYLNYEAGEWSSAKDLLESTRFLLGTEDGPSAALLRFLKKHDWKAPQHWPGYRILTDK